MAVNVDFWTGFSKRKNSTKRPLDSAKTTIPCFLKEATSKESPTFIIETRSGQDPSIYNYCSAWGNYYYISEREYIPPFWHLHCDIDYLATFRTEIGASSQYIERADDIVKWDGRLLDSLPTQTAPSTSVVNFGEPLFPNVATGSWVVTVMGTDGPPSSGEGEGEGEGDDFDGGINRWVFNDVGYKAFMQQFTNQFSWTDPEGTIPGLISDQVKALLRPYDYILDARWYPFVPAGSITEKTIWLGAWNTGINGYLMTEGYIYTKTKTMTIPKHPQASTDGLFLNSGTYSKYVWVDPFFGVINVDGNSICDCTTLNYRIDIDPSTGFGHMKMTATVDDQMVTVAERNCEFGVPQYRTYGAHDIINSIGSVFSNPVAGTLDLIKSVAQPKVEVAGSPGSRAMYQFQPLLYCEFYRIKPLNPHLQGYPICATYNIGSMSGYIKCYSGDVNIPGNPEAKEEIKNYMEGGFYFE